MTQRPIYEPGGDLELAAYTRGATLYLPADEPRRSYATRPIGAIARMFGTAIILLAGLVSLPWIAFVLSGQQ